MPKYREAIRMLLDQGWYLSRSKGSHDIYKHPSKRGIVVIAGRSGDDIPIGTWNEILRQAGKKGDSK